MKLDILALAAHPDDAELSCSGTLALHATKGYKTGIVDFTRGELGTRGTPELRKDEAANAAKVLELSFRHNLELRDGFFGQSDEELKAVIAAIRHTRPTIVLCNAIKDRHPDHGNGAALAVRACFLSGLAKIETTWEGQPQEPWRPQQVFHYIQDQFMVPDFVVDISPVWDKKVNSIKAYSSQFYSAEMTGPTTYISTPEFWDFVEARAIEFAHGIGAKYAEGFVKSRQVVLSDLMSLVPGTTLI